MRIGINCLEVNPSFVGGVNTYVTGLLDGFAAVGNGCRFRLFVTTANQSLFSKYAGNPHFETVVLNEKSFLLRKNLCRATLFSHSEGIHKFACDSAFNAICNMMELESDIVYTPTPVLLSFSNRKPTVLTMHDIQHVHHPEFFNWSRRLSRRITYGLSARHASYLQANSQYTKEDLLSHFPWLAPEQVEVIPSGVLIEKFSTPAPVDALSRRYDLPERFLFCPAQLWPHKNHLTILKALKLIEAEHGLKIPLILTGGKFSEAPRIFDFIASQSMSYVRYLGKVSSEDMVALYQKAAFMITATLHESSSLPVLEAAAAGTPVIASRIPPLEELAGVLQLNLFAPLDAQELARLIYALWDDGRLSSAQAAHNREQARLFSWEKTARKYVQLFERVVNS
jgi:glycosyltransferase involved in cell wall biosynthesis